MLDVKTTVKVPSQTIKPEMLVESVTDGSIGLVVQVTKRYVHVAWLVNKNPGTVYDENNNTIPSTDVWWKTRGQHHFVTEELRKSLKTVPAGTTVTITQTEK